MTPAVRKGPEGKDNESFLHEDVDKDSGTFQTYFCLHWLWFGRILWYMVALRRDFQKQISIMRFKNSTYMYIYICAYTTCISHLYNT